MSVKNLEPKILIVHEDEGMQGMLSGELKKARYRTDIADSKEKALDKIVTDKGKDPFNLVIAHERNIKGLELLREIRYRNFDLGFILLTRSADINSSRKLIKTEGANDYLVIECGLTDLLPVVEGVLKEVRIIRTQKELEEKFRKDYVDITEIVLEIIREKDSYTYGHSQRVGKYSEIIASECKISAQEARKTGLLHDTGKIFVSEETLTTSRKLTPSQDEEIKSHPVRGERVIGQTGRGSSEIFMAIRHHHEKYKGGGYPDGLKGDKISLLAQIISAADIFDAITFPRTYNDRISPSEAIARIGEEFNPVVEEALKKAYTELARACQEFAQK